MVLDSDMSALQVIFGAIGRVMNALVSQLMCAAISKFYRVCVCVCVCVCARAHVCAFDTPTQSATNYL